MTSNRAPDKDPGGPWNSPSGAPDTGGETIGTATVIAALPYVDTGNTCGARNDYDPTCAQSYAGDLVYRLTPSAAGCSSSYGRRRVGKTRPLRHWLQVRDGLYSQAIEAQRDQQIQQVFLDLRARLETQIIPKTWTELLEILALQKRRWVLCLAEFPYLTATDPSLPSQLQRWLDHSLRPGRLLVLARSSTRMMNDLFLHRAAPLFGRTRKLLHVQPTDAALCRACGQDAGDVESSEKFTCVGASPGTGSSSKPSRASYSSRSRSTSTLPPTWSRSRSGFCATKASRG